MIKTKLYQKCCQIVEKQTKAIQVNLAEVQEAANNETKSSAGDKHETGRAMAQLETEKLSSQLTETLKLKHTLDKINTEENKDTIGLGSIVKTNNGNFYVAISLGRIDFENEIYFAISSASPIGQLLLTKKEQDSFSFNDNTYKILSVT